MLFDWARSLYFLKIVADATMLEDLQNSIFSFLLFSFNSSLFICLFINFLRGFPEKGYKNIWIFCFKYYEIITNMKK